MSGWVLFGLSLFGALLVANAAWPRRGPVSLLPSWIGVFLTTDLVFHHIVLQVITVAVFWKLGALQTPQGQAAIVIMVVSSMALVRIWRPALKTQAVADAVADQLGLVKTEALPRSLLLTPFPATRKGVEKTRNVQFIEAGGKPLKLDIYRPKDGGGPCPALVYVHGGGYLTGDKRDQGLPLCNHMATLGWVCFNINYRLSPAATWPEHLIDTKAAIAWIREHADEYGVDRSFIAIAGGSAGAHIAAMAALVPDDPVLQPGFENTDTSVQAVATSYGIYDLTNRHGAHNPEYLTKMMGPFVLKADPATEIDKFSAASPHDNLRPDAPPWLVLHGSDDQLVPVVEAREFHAALSQTSAAVTGYAEFPEASHAFDVYYCHRALAAVDLTARFLVSARSSSNAASRHSE